MLFYLSHNSPIQALRRRFRIPKVMTKAKRPITPRVLLSRNPYLRDKAYVQCFEETGSSFLRPSGLLYASVNTVFTRLKSVKFLVMANTKSLYSYDLVIKHLLAHKRNFPQNFVILMVNWSLQKNQYIFLYTHIHKSYYYFTNHIQINQFFQFLWIFEMLTNLRNTRTHII